MTRLVIPTFPDTSTYSLVYVWERQRVILRVNRELSPQSARDLASSLLYFADTAEKKPSR